MITLHRISRALNLNMENQKTNLRTATNRASLTSHRMTVSKTSMTNAETEQENFQATTPLETRRLKTKVNI